MTSQPRPHPYPGNTHSSGPPIHWDTSHFGFVTLWGGRAHAERTLDWLAAAEIPPHSTLYWLDNSGGHFTARLRAEWQERLRSRFRRLVFIHAGAPYAGKPGEGSGSTRRFLHVARLYNRIFPQVSEDAVITIEDDMVPPLDGVRSLLHLLHASDRVGVASGVYRDRYDPTRISAASDKRYWLGVPFYDTLPAHPFEVGMAGGGFMLMTSRALQETLPVQCQKFENGQELGWDGTLCTRLTALGYRIMIDPGVRCAHLCPEVLDYEARLERR